MTRRVLKSLLLFISCPLILCACVGNSTAPNPIYYYTLNYESHVQNPIERLSYVLHINQFSTSPPFNTQNMVYSDKSLRRNSYTYHQWIASPGELLSYFLARDLDLSDGFTAALPADSPQSATHEIYGWIEEFIEIDHHNPWLASARIHITLTSGAEPDPSRRILMQKRYSQTTACSAKTPAAFAEAMSSCIAKIFESVVRDIHARLSRVQSSIPKDTLK